MKGNIDRTRRPFVRPSPGRIKKEPSGTVVRPPPDALDGGPCGSSPAFPPTRFIRDDERGYRPHKSSLRSTVPRSHQKKAKRDCRPSAAGCVGRGTVRGVSRFSCCPPFSLSLHAVGGLPDNETPSGARRFFILLNKSALGRGWGVWGEGKHPCALAVECQYVVHPLLRHEAGGFLPRAEWGRTKL